MALPAGRKGVLPSELTPEGKLKIPQPESELPDYSSSDAGKFLGVDSNGNLEFTTPESELPDYSSSDAGKVLGVDSNGDLEFATPAAGGGGFGTIVLDHIDTGVLVERTYDKDGFLFLSTNTSAETIWSIEYADYVGYGGKKAFSATFKEATGSGGRENAILFPVFAGMKMSFYGYSSVGVLMCTYIPFK